MGSRAEHSRLPVARHVVKSAAVCGLCQSQVFGQVDDAMLAEREVAQDGQA